MCARLLCIMTQFTLALDASPPPHQGTHRPRHSLARESPKFSPSVAGQRALPASTGESLWAAGVCFSEAIVARPGN